MATMHATTFAHDSARDRRAAPTRHARRLLRTAAFGVALTVGAAGCEVPSFLDPTVVTDPDKSNQLREDGSATPIVSVILDDLDLGVSAPTSPTPTPETSPPTISRSKPPITSSALAISCG